MPIQHHPINPSLTLNSTNPNHKNIILTRPRTSDAELTIPAFNHPSIYLNLTGPPFPYTQESFDSFFKEVLDKNVQIAVAELRDAKLSEENGNGKRWVGAIPFPSIREVVVNGKGEREEVFIGQTEIRRRGYMTVLGEDERQRLVKGNEGRKIGDPEIEWEIGFFLLPSHHGRSIMPAVLQTLLTDFFIPYMNMHHMEGEYLEFNGASRRVFEKCGFRFVGVTERVEVVPEGKRGALRELLELEREGKEGKRKSWVGKGEKWLLGEKVGLGALRWERERERESRDVGEVVGSGV
ncbi:hypothetical protein SBOR_1492 [Sclerotinia borealis F-4128]|uniref:N-acetyltransferase domain-containing protein n=1 Tax=Sclerotinia borealis (strain F-4128) TaxID=1432307 RepID=W9CPX3_SCLBF|nr:hypothetical protein SBOR_1492 [Sclerotinia borealis F-4128]